MGNTSASILTGFGKGGKGYNDTNDYEGTTGGAGFGDDNEGGDIPIAEITTASSKVQEADIYVPPPAPQQAKGDLVIPAAPGAASHNKDNENDDENGDDVDAKFDDLQSRFSRLKR